MSKEIRMGDVFELVPYEGIEAPDYILKNGKSLNVYGAYEYIKDQQAAQAVLVEQNAELLEALELMIGEYEFYDKDTGEPDAPAQSDSVRNAIALIHKYKEE